MTEPEWMLQYADLIADRFAAALQRIGAILREDPRGDPPTRAEVRDAVDRVLGRTSFEEYLRRNRSRRHD